VTDGNGRLRWQFLFEWVIVPMTGLILAVVGSVTGLVDRAWIPVILFFVAFPFARTVDRLRRDR
jgi:hypothetical protein